MIGVRGALTERPQTEEFCLILEFQQECLQKNF